MEVILIYLGWVGAMWWPKLVELRTEIATIQLPSAADCLRFPRGITEELTNLDPLYGFHIRGKVIYSPVVVVLMF